MRDLAPTTGTEVYEAWVIGADGVPVAARRLPVGSAGTGVLHGDRPVRGAGRRPGAHARAGAGRHGADAAGHLERDVVAATG